MICPDIPEVIANINIANEVFAEVGTPSAEKLHMYVAAGARLTPEGVDQRVRFSRVMNLQRNRKHPGVSARRKSSVPCIVAAVSLNIEWNSSKRDWAFRETIGRAGCVVLNSCISKLSQVHRRKCRT